MSAASQKYHQVTLKSLPNATFSLELEDGQLLLDLPVGQTIALFGQDHRLANLSALPEIKKEPATSDTSGQPFSISLESKRLQQSLANKLQAQLGTDGSMIYKKTWKTKTTPAQWQYCQLAASAHRTKGKDSGTSLTDWPTPRATEIVEDYNKYLLRMKNSKHIKKPREDQAEQCINGGVISDKPLANTKYNGYSRQESNQAQQSCDKQIIRLPDGGYIASKRESTRDADFWSESRNIDCRDGKTRTIPTEPALFPLANGIPNRMGLLRGAGNAIVPQVAAEVIKAFMAFECEPL